ncbi:hypothetical protein U1872_06265 [Sphingomonas sp. RB3P16]|uniref:hypothetical protein n=1 Tax=Parasphingomonas frigoris TaxID=3096163 RepID=UPI002FCB3E42
MKRVSIAIALLALSGCMVATAPQSADNTAIWTDPSTGCRYIVYRDGLGNTSVGSLSIRFRRDGKPDCPGATS